MYMRIKDEKWTIENTIGLIAFLLFVGFISWTLADIKMEQQDRRQSCLEEYGDTQIQNIPGKCLRYLK